MVFHLHNRRERAEPLVRIDSVARIGSHPAGILGGSGAVLYVMFIGLPILALLVRSAQQSNFLDAVTNDAALTALRLSLLTSIISMEMRLITATRMISERMMNITLKSQALKRRSLRRSLSPRADDSDPAVERG